MTQTRVVIVDRQALFRQALVLVLGQQPNWSVVGEADAVQDTLVRLRDLECDLLISDLMFPDGTGLDIARCVLKSRPATKVVILTSEQNEDWAFEAIRAGVKGYLPKDLTMRELLGYLRSVQDGDTVLAPTLIQRLLTDFTLRHDCWEKSDSKSSRSGWARSGAAALTQRERDVVQALTRGASNSEIAAELVISENTVKHHVGNILGKLHLHSRRELVNYAGRR